MDLSKIITISGKSGLFRIISETRNGLVVESLTDGRKTPVFATERSSILEDINIFTTEGEMPLKNVIWRLYEHQEGKALDNPKKDQAAAMAKFEEMLPEYDKERVYFNDIKKVFNWYNLLLDKDLISKPEEEEEKTDGDKEPGQAPEAAKEKEKKDQDQ